MQYERARAPQMPVWEKVGKDRLRAALAVARSQFELCRTHGLDLPFGVTPSDYACEFRRLAENKHD